MKVRKILLPLVLAIFAIGFFSVFVVKEINQAIVLQFGDPKRIITTPGFQVKIPFIQNVVFLDRRILSLDPPPEEVIASDQKRLIVDAFARFKILRSKNTTFCIKGIFTCNPGFTITFFGSPNCRTIA